MGLTEPAVSRTIRGLKADGHVATDAEVGAGNRRAVRLTAAGQALVNAAAEQLEAAFGTLLDAAGLRPDDVLALTDPIIRTLTEGDSE
jgi:DNA-binding MarR family transcriptional regulator